MVAIPPDDLLDQFVEALFASSNENRLTWIPKHQRVSKRVEQNLVEPIATRAFPSGSREVVELYLPPELAQMVQEYAVFKRRDQHDYSAASCWLCDAMDCFTVGNLVRPHYGPAKDVNVVFAFRKICGQFDCRNFKYWIIFPSCIQDPEHLLSRLPLAKQEICKQAMLQNHIVCFEICSPYSSYSIHTFATVSLLMAALAVKHNL